MSAVRNFLQSILPKSMFAAMEAESKTWMMKCEHCSHEHSIWDMGGIRYKAASKSKRYYVRCPNCQQASWQALYKKTA